MRLHSLLALAAACATALPVYAATGTIPDKGNYMDQCIQEASKNLGSAAKANEHCKCSAGVLESNFSSAQIEQMGKPGANSELIMQAQQKIAASCAKK